MPVGIGKKEVVAPGDPLRIFLECHDRIRRFVALAEKLASPPPDATPQQIAEGAADVLRYFTVSLPLHEQDEEESLGGRLRERTHTLAPEASRALAALQLEHREIEEQLEGLSRRWKELAGEPDRIGTLRSVIAGPTARLKDLFEAHLAAEEGALFPAARKLLPPAELEAIKREAEARRR